MKKIFIAALLALPSMAMAQTLVKTSAHSYDGNMVNETGLTHSATYSLSLPLYDGNKVSVVVTYASAAFTAATFSDGAQSTGAVTILSTTALSGESITIAGTPLVAGTDFLVGASVNATASNLARVINASTCPLASIMSATAVGAVVTATISVVGQNYPLVTSNVAKMRLSGALTTGGTGAYYSAATDNIILPSHGFTLGLPLLYTQGAAIGGLTSGTTYYAIPVDANTIKLAASSALALAGTYVNITTQRSQLVANTYTLAPLAIAGTPGFYFQGSNDGTHFVTINISSVSINSYTAGGATVGFDFDNFNFQQLFMNVTGPTAGAILLKAVAFIKQY